MKVQAGWCLVAASLLIAGALVAAQAGPSVSDGWVAEPASGATTTDAYVIVDNPTMYEIFIVGVTADAAASAEIVQGAAAERMKELAVPSYGRTELKPGAMRIRLKDLKKPLKEGDSVSLTLTTDGGTTLKIVAAVKKG